MATLTVRTDPVTDRALAELTADGTSTSDAVRAAILHTWRDKRRSALADEAEAARNDPEDVAAMRALREEMDALRAW